MAVVHIADIASKLEDEELDVVMAAISCLEKIGESHGGRDTIAYQVSMSVRVMLLHTHAE